MPLGEMPIMDSPFKRVAIDLIGPINPTSDRGNRYILKLVDYMGPDTQKQSLYLGLKQSG